jgi:glycosyltransferase involved in cell wall biosynthesis
MDLIKFSIGIPAYKGKYLNDCIQSILNQTYCQFELIIINDCSPDPVKGIVDLFEDPRIKYYKNEKNIGAENVVMNWNKCLEGAQNDFFILMGDDDKMEPDYLEELVKLIYKYPDLDIFHCRSKIIDEHSNFIMLTPSCPEFESVYDNIWHSMNGYRIPYISDFIYRTSTLKERGGFYHLPLAWASDNISSYIAMEAKGIAHTNKPLLNYRSHSLSITSSGNYELKIKAIALQQKWFRNFFKKKPILLNDLVLYNDLCRNIDKILQKKKIYTVAYSLAGNLPANFLKCLNRRKKYELSFSEIAYSLIIYIKEKKSKTKYA